MRRIRLILPAFALSVAMTSRGGAQARVPVVTLDRGAREFAESFSGIAQVVELRDGRLLVVDNGEKELRLVDLTRGTMSAVGRQGGGPVEYRMPGMLLPGASDTVAYYDPMQQRFLLISPQGAPARTVPFGAAGDEMAAISRMTPTGTDAAGRIYGQTMGMKLPTPQSAAQGPMPTFADSIEIQSLDFRSGKTTKLASIRSPTSQLAPKMARAGGSVKFTMTTPDFSPLDVWAALPDGRIAILRDGIYRVHLVGPGRPETAGALIPSIPVPVTALEKKVLVDSIRKAMDNMIGQVRKGTASAASASGRTAAPPNIEAEVLEPRSWAANKSPFTTLRSSPDGRLWVTLAQPAGTKTAKYDVLNGSGALIAQVVLIAGEHLVGLGRGTVYTIRKDRDDLQYLRKYVLPRMP